MPAGCRGRRTGRTAHDTPRPVRLAAAGTRPQLPPRLPPDGCGSGVASTTPHRYMGRAGDLPEGAPRRADAVRHPGDAHPRAEATAARRRPRLRTLLQRPPLPRRATRDVAGRSPRIVPHGPLPLDPAASALQYAQAMFEGMKAVPGERGPLLFRPDMHVRRFNASARRLCMPEVPEADFLAALRAIVREDAGVGPHRARRVALRSADDDRHRGLPGRPARRGSTSSASSPRRWGTTSARDPAPLRLWVETEHVRAARGGIGAAKAGANYVAGMAAAERAKKARASTRCSGSTRATATSRRRGR